MAIFNFRFGIVKRSAGESVVAAAAWQHGLKLHAEYDGKISRFQARRNVIAGALELPPSAPEWAVERFGGDLKTAVESFWNAVETREAKSNRWASAQLARRIGAALPIELSHVENVALSRRYLSRLFVKLSMPLSWSIVEGKNGPYLQALVSFRRLEKDGFGLKVVDQDRRAFIMAMRIAWAEDVNAALEQAGSDARVDHRSNKERGLPPPDQPAMNKVERARWRDTQAGEDI